MAELALVFMGGLLGSSHCIGMCGGFVVSIGATSAGLSANARRQLAYTVGRVFTYATMGAAAGYVGLRLVRTGETLVNVQAALAIVAGGLLVAQGLAATGWFRRPVVAGRIPCLAGGILRAFLNAPGLRNAFLAGMLTGFMPCGLVYAYLALAASTGSMFDGLLRMGAFGLGTGPLLVLFGCGSSMLNMVVRRQVLRWAAVCVVIVGLVSIARGVGVLPASGGDEPAGCLFCSEPANPAVESIEQPRPAKAQAR